MLERNTPFRQLLCNKSRGELFLIAGLRVLVQLVEDVEQVMPLKGQVGRAERGREGLARKAEHGNETVPRRIGLTLVAGELGQDLQRQLTHPDHTAEGARPQ